MFGVGLTSLDSLLVLLLVEITWWSAVFLGQYIPALSALIFFYNKSKSTETVDFFENEEKQELDLKLAISQGVFLILRAKVPVFLLFIILRNNINGHEEKLKISLFLTIALDVCLIVFNIFSSIIENNFAHLLNPSIYLIAPFIFLRLILWIQLSKTVFKINAEHKEGSSLFSYEGLCGVFKYLGSNTKSLLEILLSYEIIFGIVELIASINLFGIYYFRFYDSNLISWGAVLPHGLLSNHVFSNSFVNTLIVWTTIFLQAVIYAIQLVAVQKNWIILIKIWLPLLFTFSIIFYSYLTGWTFFYTFENMKVATSYFEYPTSFSFIFLIGEILTTVSRLVLRLVIFIYSIKFVKNYPKNDSRKTSPLTVHKKIRRQEEIDKEFDGEFAPLVDPSSTFN